VPVLGGEAEHEHAEDVQEAAAGEDDAVVARVEGPAGDDADAEDEQELRRADPGHLGVVAYAKLVDVVGLEGAEGVDEAPGAEDDEVAEEGDGPGVGGVLGVCHLLVLVEGLDGGEVMVGTCGLAGLV
jgi:hypothetical protein